MKRIVITSEGDEGRWFDADKSEVFYEYTVQNGNNRISCATGSQWEHEALYRTAGGNWVLNHWSQWQGSTETYTIIDNQEAARWLVRNDQGSVLLQTEIADLELA